MAITSRPATLADIDRCLSIQPLYLGNALVGRRAAVDAWKQLARDGFSASSVLESTSPATGRSDRGLWCFGVSCTCLRECRVGESSPGHQLPGHSKRALGPVGIGNSR